MKGRLARQLPSRVEQVQPPRFLGQTTGGVQVKGINGGSGWETMAKPKGAEPCHFSR